MGWNTGISVYLQSHTEKFATFSDRRGSTPANNTLVIDMDVWTRMGQPDILRVEVREGVSGQ